MATLIGPTPKTRPHRPGAEAELDRLIGDVCEALQISGTQYRNAEEKYQNVGRWLAAEENPLAKLKPVIYAQGSMALQTTVRPWTDEDCYDLDLVLEVQPTSDDPMTLYSMVERRLRESPHYRDILERKKRCLALNFVGDDYAFHMDILPARPDEVRGGTCVEVPDRQTPTRWQPSNPKGYREWFESQATREAILLAERKQEPLPDNDPAFAKAVLKRVVQLMKRRRDLLIRNDDLSPRSIVLTTLAAQHYRGEQHVVPALLTILTGIRGQIDAAKPNRIEVCNPTNPDEKFCESFCTKEQYDEFVKFIDNFLTEVNELAGTMGVLALKPKLSGMFGETITKRALLEYGNRLTAAREGGEVLMETRGAKAALTIGTGAAGTGKTSISESRSRVVPGNTFYGE